MLWIVGTLWRSPVIALHTVVTAVTVGIVFACLIYWLLDKFSGRSRG